jgi:hypothetical protein
MGPYRATIAGLALIASAAATCSLSVGYRSVVAAADA